MSFFGNSSQHPNSYEIRRHPLNDRDEQYPVPRGRSPYDNGNDYRLRESVYYSNDRDSRPYQETNYLKVRGRSPVEIINYSRHREISPYNLYRDEFPTHQRYSRQSRSRSPQRHRNQVSPSACNRFLSMNYMDDRVSGRDYEKNSTRNLRVDSDYPRNFRDERNYLNFKDDREYSRNFRDERDYSRSFRGDNRDYSRNIKGDDRESTRNYRGNDSRNYDRDRLSSRSFKGSGSNQRRPRNKKTSADDAAPVTCIGVFGLSKSTNESCLQGLFCQFGKINELRLITDKITNESRGFCFITYDELDSAIRAKEECSGMEVDGKQIRVDFSITANRLKRKQESVNQENGVKRQKSNEYTSYEEGECRDKSTSNLETSNAVDSKLVSSNSYEIDAKWSNEDEPKRENGCVWGLDNESDN